MRKLKLLFASLALLVVGLGQVGATVINWTSKTSLITNPSFESDEAIANLKECGWATDRATGWTITPASSGNAQIGVGNASSTIQGIGDTFAPSDGDNYFYTRNNWNKTTTYTLSQTINAGSIPAGLYKLTCKCATYSSDAAFNTLTLSLQEGTKTPVAHSGIVLNVWNTWGVILHKQADDTNLTLKVSFIPGNDGSGKHYAVLLDDFQLEFIAEEDAFSASETNTIDFSDIINNANVYNHSTKATMPRGWTAYKHTTGNGNFTEGQNGDTRFEGWSGGNLDIDYYQEITNLPVGSYTITAAAQERAEVGKTYIYGYTDGKDKATGLVNSKTESDITTSVLKVTNGTMNIGVESTANDWVTADNFRINFLGFDVDAVKAAYETAYSAATTARDADENANIVGTERTTFVGVITTYTTDATQSYGWYVTAKEALETAISNFTAAKPSYDALVAEIAKAKALGIATATADGYAATSSSTAATALTSTQNLMVAEYNYVTTSYQYGVDLGAWTEVNITTRRGQHWDGTTDSSSGTQYYEMNDGWGSNSWTMSMNQNLTLPAGNYVLKAAGRQASGNCQLSLVVKKGDDVIGTVADFPKGDTGLGINKSGATSFDSEDAAGFANNGAGRGFQWRYVKFTLDSDATVNVAVNGEGNEKFQWVSFCNATVQTDNEANISLIAYNIALNDANTAFNDDTYENVRGDEYNELWSAIAGDNTLDKTNKVKIDEAKALLIEKTSAFTDAKGAYDAFVAAKVAEYAELPYANATKYAAIATAQGAAAATSAADATAKTAAITVAYRKYLESNALAEGVTGAVAIDVPDYRFAGLNTDSKPTIGAWTVWGQTNGNIQLLSSQSFTDGDGNADYTYIDIAKNDNNAGIEQSISLEPGKYMMTVTARCKSGMGAKFEAYAGGVWVNIPQQGASGGQFGNGWNDVSVEFTVYETGDAKIGVKSDYGKDIWWSATRFRLVRLGDAAEKVTVTDAGYATYVSDVALDYSSVSDLTAYKASVSGTTINFTKVGKVPAGQGVLLKGEGTFNVPMVASAEALDGNAFIRGTGAAIASEADGKYNYILNNVGGVVGFYKANGKKVGTNRAYIQTPVSASRLNFVFDDEEEVTGIKTINAVKNGEAIYNLNGQRVNKTKNGLYILNGRKVMFK